MYRTHNNDVCKYAHIHTKGASSLQCGAAYKTEGSLKVGTTVHTISVAFVKVHSFHNCMTQRRKDSVGRCIRS